MHFALALQNFPRPARARTDQLFFTGRMLTTSTTISTTLIRETLSNIELMLSIHHTYSEDVSSNGNWIFCF